MLALASTASGSAFGQVTRLVDSNTGSDTGNCSSSPCATIQYAIGEAAAGDVIDLAAGTYAETVQVNQPLTLTGSGPAASFIDGNVRISANDVTVSNLAIINGATVLGETSALYIDGGTSGHTISGLQLTGTGASATRGVIFAANVTEVDVLGLTITDWTTGIYINPGADNINISGNIISDTVAGIGGDDYGNVVINNNDLFDNGEAIGYSGPAGSGPTITNNEFSNNGAHVNSYGDATLDADTILADNSFVDGVVANQTQGSLLPTIQSAIDGADPGDTLFAPAGTYAESLAVNTADITLLGEQAGIDPAGRSAGGMNESIIDAQTGVKAVDILASGFTLDGFSVTTTNGVLRGVFESNSVSGSVYANNFVYGFTNTYGISLSAGSSGAMVDNNVISGTYGGIYLSANGTGATVSGNAIDGLAAGSLDQGSAITLEGNITGASIIGNVLTNNANGVYVFDGFGPDFSGTTISDNQIVGNAVGVNNTNATGTVDATCNFWGDASGPSGVGPGTGDQALGNVEVVPWNRSQGDACLGANPNLALTLDVGLPAGVPDEEGWQNFTAQLTNTGDLVPENIVLWVDADGVGDAEFTGGFNLELYDGNDWVSLGWGGASGSNINRDAWFLGRAPGSIPGFEIPAGYNDVVPLRVDWPNGNYSATISVESLDSADGSGDAGDRIYLQQAEAITARTGPVDDVYVDSSYAGSEQGDALTFTEPGGNPVSVTFGLDAYASVYDALDVVAENGRIQVASGDFFDLASGQPLEINTTGVTLTTDPAGPATLRYGFNDFFPVIEVFAENATIENFDIVRDDPAPAGQAIAIRKGGATVQNLSITGSNASAVAAITLDHGLPSAYGSNVDNVLITNNTITGDFAWGIGVATRSADGAILGATITDNVIDGTAGGAFFFNSGGTVSGIQNITYTGNSHLNLTGSNLLFQSFEVLDPAAFLADNVVGRWARVDGAIRIYRNIQNAIDAAADNDTVLVSAGTFAESLQIDGTSGLTLLGAQAGVAPSGRTAGGPGESIIDAQTGDKAVDILASGFTLDGFSVTTTNGVLRGVFESNSVSGSVYANNFVYGFTNTYGISLSAGSSGAMVDNNVISGTYGGIYLSANGTGATVSGNAIDGLTAGSLDQGSAITLEGNITGASIIGNVLTNNANGVYVFDGFGPDFSGTTISDNQIVGNAVGVNNTNVTGTVDAPCNWWGEESGPSGEGPGAGDSVTPNVIFEPWQTAAGASCDGYEFPVTRLSDGATFGSYTDAIDDPGTTAGDTLTGSATTYEENIVVDQALTITGGGSSSTLIDGNVRITADNVILGNVGVLNGATVLGETSGIYIDGGTSGHTIDSIELVGAGSPTRGIIFAGGSGGVSDVDVINSTISGWTTGIYINPGADDITISGNSISDTVAGIGGDDYGNVVIDDNQIFDNEEGIGYSGPAGTGPTITNNDFSNNDAHVRSFGAAALDVEAIEAANTFDAVVANITQGSLLVTIQDAIDTADAGDVLFAPAGTYAESLVVNVDSLTLRGEQAGVNPSSRTAGGAAESIIDAQAGDKAVDILASGFTLDGFSVTTTAGVLRGIFESNSVSGSTIANNFIDGFTNTYGVSLSAGSSGAMVADNVIGGTYGGIYLSANGTGATVSGNTVDGLAGGSLDQGSAITLEGNITGASITGNVLTNNANGVYVFDGFGPDFSGTAISDNQIVGNALGVNNTNATGTVEATCNWWGDESGPSGEGDGSGDAVSANVDFQPWNLEVGGDCFGGYAETVYVDDDFAGSDEGDTVSFTHPSLGSPVSATFGTDAFASVLTALGNVSVDGTVLVAEGSYPGGNLTFDRGQDLMGAGTATLLSGLGDIVLESDNVSITQLQIDGYDSFRINPSLGGVSNAVISDNVLRLSAQHGIVVDGSGWVITDNVIEGAAQLGLLGGFIDGASDILVRGNEITDSGLSGAFFSDGADVTFLKNEVTGNADWGLVSDSDTVTMGFNRSQSGGAPALEARTASSVIYCNQVRETVLGDPSTVTATDAGIFVSFNALYDGTVVQNTAASGQLDATLNWWETGPATLGDVATDPELDSENAFYEACFPTPTITLDQNQVAPGDPVAMTVDVAKPATIGTGGFDLGLTGVAFDVTIPAGLSAAIDSDACGATLSGGVLSVDGGSLPSGTDSCSIELTLSTGTVDGFEIDSTVFTSQQTGDGALTGSAELFVGAPDLQLTQTAGVDAGLPQPTGWEYFTANLVNNGTAVPEDIVLWIDIPAIDDAAVSNGATLQFWDAGQSAWVDFGWGGASSYNVDRDDFFLGRGPTSITGFPIGAGYDEEIAIRHNFADGAYDSTTTVESLDSADPQVTVGERVYLDQSITLAEVTISDLMAVYDTDPQPVTITTAPAGANVDVTYDGGTVVPVVAGSYTVNATVDEPGVIGQQIETLTIVAADQTIDFPTIPNQPADAAPFTISASASSGLTVGFSIVSGPASINGNEVTLTGSLGEVVVAADQAGSANYNPAPTVERSFQVVEGDAASIEAASAVSINGTAGEPVAGDLPTVRVTDSQDNPVSGVTVSFSIGSGSGSVTGATQVTDASGLAQVGGWTLGGDATQTLEAAAPGLTGSPVVFSANVPLLGITPASADYGPIGILDSAVADFTVSNDGSAQSAIELTGITVNGDAEFTLNGTGNCATGDTLAGGESCTIEVSFDPAAVATFSGSLDITSDAGDVSASLSGEGINPDWADGFDGAFDEDGWQFFAFDGSPTLYEPATAQISGDYLQVNDPAAIYAGGYIPRSFGESRVTSLVNADGTNTGTSPDNQIDQGVISHFDPDQLEGYTAYIRYELNVQELVLAKFDAANLDPALIDVRSTIAESTDGDWSMDRMYVVELDVVGQGSDALLVARAFDADTGELLGTVEAVDADPFGPGYAGVTAITNETGINGTFDTASAASSFASADLSANSIDFATQEAFSASAAQSITVDNRGNVDLAISSLTVAGTNAGDFSIQNSDCSDPVAAGGSCSFEVVFTPGAATPREAELVIESNASTTPDAVLLEGEGTPATATVTLSDLTQTYDGGPKPVGVGTMPAGLNVAVTYDGSTMVPVDAGTYTVVADIDEPDYVGSASDQLTIEAADQTIDFPAIANQPADAAPFTISATADSGLMVSFTVVSGPATISGNEVTLTGTPGQVVIAADQAGNGNYNAAPTVQQSFQVVEGNAASIEAASAVAINGTAGQPVAAGDLPTVLVTDAQANPVSGVTVSFSIGSGSGSITGATQVTDASGLAQVGSWTLGSEDTQVLLAESPGLTGSPVNFTATTAASIDLTISIDDGVETIERGERNTYVIVASNNGPSEATGVSVTAPLPAEFEAAGADWTCAAGTNATCGATTGTGGVDDTGAIIGSGASLVYVLEADVGQGGTDTITVNATVESGPETAADADTTLIIATGDPIFSDRFEASAAPIGASVQLVVSGSLDIANGFQATLPSTTLVGGRDRQGEDAFRIRTVGAAGLTLVRMEVLGQTGDWTRSPWLQMNLNGNVPLSFEYDADLGSLFLIGERNDGLIQAQTATAPVGQLYTDQPSRISVSTN